MCLITVIMKTLSDYASNPGARWCQQERVLKEKSSHMTGFLRAAGVGISPLYNFQKPLSVTLLVGLRKLCCHRTSGFLSPLNQYELTLITTAAVRNVPYSGSGIIPRSSLSGAGQLG